MELCEDERVDGVMRMWGGWDAWALEGAKGPPVEGVFLRWEGGRGGAFRPGSTLVNPALEESDLSFGEGFLVTFLWGHRRVAVCAAYEMQEGAFGGIAGEDGGVAGFTALQSPVSLIEAIAAFLFFRTMTAHAVGLEDGRNMALKIDAVCRFGVRGERPREEREQW